MLRGVDDPAQIESALGLSVCAMIPFTNVQRNLAKNFEQNESAGNNLLAVVDSGDLAAEALRSLRNSLQFLMLEAKNNVVMLTGPAPGIDKSFITINLGAIIALSGKKVVVVDADLRLGHLHKFIGAPQAPGLSDFISGRATMSEVVKPLDVEGLALVTGGTRPPNPAELLMHGEFKRLIDHLSREYDFVVVDTPPALAVADAAVVGNLAGTTLMVLKSAQHPMREVEETYRRLLQAGVEVRGVIFNQVGMQLGSYGYGGYGYSYNRYSYSYKYKE